MGGSRGLFGFLWGEPGDGEGAPITVAQITRCVTQNELSFTQARPFVPSAVIFCVRRAVCFSGHGTKVLQNSNLTSVLYAQHADCVSAGRRTSDAPRPQGGDLSGPHGAGVASAPRSLGFKAADSPIRRDRARRHARSTQARHFRVPKSSRPYDCEWLAPSVEG